MLPNDHGQWPPIDTVKSTQIKNIIEKVLKPLSIHLKRTRTHEWKRKKHSKTKSTKQDINMETVNDSKSLSMNIQPKEISNEQKHSILLALLIKKHFLFGINTITKCLEKSTRLHMLLVFSNSTNESKPSAKTPIQVDSSRLTQSLLNQFNLLTKHLRIMCANLNVPAGCLDSTVSSHFLSKLLNMNRISSFALLATDSIDAKNVELSILKLEKRLKTNLLAYYNEHKPNLDAKTKNLVDELAYVRIYFPKLEEKSHFDKFLSLDLEKFVTDHLKQHDCIEPSIESKVQTDEKKYDDSEKLDIVIEDDSDGEATTTNEMMEFGADYISIDLKTQKSKSSGQSERLEFTSKNFILFDNDK